LKTPISGANTEASQLLSLVRPRLALATAGCMEGRMVRTKKLSKMKLLIMCFTMVAINSCTPHLKVTMPDKVTNKFSTSEKIDRVIVDERTDLKSHKTLLVLSDPADIKYINFIVSSFKNMNYFETVLSSVDFKIQLDTKGTQITNGKEFPEQLLNNYGNCLILLLNLDKPPGFFYEGHLLVYNPQADRVLLHLYREAFAWDGLDKPMLYPLFNGFVDWAEQKTIATN
jgi:hypothetical protein